jgi:hypothetical protein
VAHDGDRSIKLVHNRLWGRRGENVREICGREWTSGFLAAVKPEGYELLDHDKVAVEHAPLLPVELNGDVDLHWATRLCCQAAHPIFHVDPVSAHTIRWRCAFISSSRLEVNKSVKALQYQYQILVINLLDLGPSSINFVFFSF